jgi:hypothetical protein
MILKELSEQMLQFITKFLLKNISSAIIFLFGRGCCTNMTYLTVQYTRWWQNSLRYFIFTSNQTLQELPFNSYHFFLENQGIRKNEEKNQLRIHVAN